MNNSNTTPESLSKAIQVLGSTNSAYRYLDSIGSGSQFRSEINSQKRLMLTDIINKINALAKNSSLEGTDLTKGVIGKDYHLIYVVNKEDIASDTLTIRSKSRSIDFSVPVATLASTKGLWEFVSLNLRCIEIADGNGRSGNLIVLNNTLYSSLSLEQADIESLGTMALADSLFAASEILSRVAEITISHDSPVYYNIKHKACEVCQFVERAKGLGLYRDFAEFSVNAEEDTKNRLYKKAVNELEKASETLKSLAMDPKPGEINKVEKLSHSNTVFEAMFGSSKTVLQPITAYDEVRDAEAQAITKIFERIRIEGIKGHDTGIRPIREILGEDVDIYAVRDGNDIDEERIVLENSDGSLLASAHLSELIYANSVCTYNFIANDLRDIAMDDGSKFRLSQSLYQTAMSKDEDIMASIEKNTWQVLETASAILADTARNCLVGNDVVKYEWIQNSVDHINDVLLENNVYDRYRHHEVVQETSDIPSHDDGDESR